MEGVYLTASELDALRGLPHPCIALYLWLRARMDVRTGIVGAPVGISWQALVEDCYVEPGRGEMPGGGPWRSPGREAVRRLVAWLVRAELIVMRSNAMQAQLVFFLPRARVLSLAQKKPDRNPTGKPDRGRSEGKSTETRQPKKAETRQTSGSQGITSGGAAANSGYSEIAREELLFPPGTTEAEQRAFGAILTKHRATRDEAQLLLDELRGALDGKGAIRNGPALLDRMATQLRAGTFWAVKAERIRGGGIGLSAEEARYANEGGSHAEE